MLDSKKQDPPGAEVRHLLLYDGVCGLCSRLVQFVLAYDRRRVFDFASLQSPTGRAATGIADGADLTTFYVIAEYQTGHARALTKGQAALFLFRVLGWPWKAAGLLGILPGAWLNWLYDVIARNRYRVFGRQDQCLIPLPEHQNRFVDL